MTSTDVPRRLATDGGGSPGQTWEQWWRSVPPWLLPVLLAAIQVGGSGLPLGAVMPMAGSLLHLLGLVLLVAGPLALLWRHRDPLLTLTVALTATHGCLLLGYVRGPYFLGAFVALVVAASRARRAAVWTITALFFVPVAGSVYLTGILSGAYGFAAVFTVAWTAVALVIGEVVRARRERYAASDRAEAAANRARAEADRARTEQFRRLASDERLRIAQELHDVIGHHLSLINVRAGVALHLFDGQPAQARDALAAIKLASAEALREVRGLLATLAPREAPRTPTPGLAALDDLAAEAEAAGTPVHIVQTGVPRPVPGEVERAAYRIVRESLTNVRRHAGPGALVTVTLDFTSEGLTVRVVDTGSGPRPSTSDDPDATVGSGVTGMRERAAALDGWLRAGPGPDGVGFVVEAFLPTPRADASAVTP